MSVLFLPNRARVHAHEGKKEKGNIQLTNKNWVCRNMGFQGTSMNSTSLGVFFVGKGGNMM